jgi:uncharacterized protein (TIGR03382 family)
VSERSRRATGTARPVRESERSAAPSPDFPATSSLCAAQTAPAHWPRARRRHAKARSTPNEIALDILLAAVTIVFLFACVTLLILPLYTVNAAGQGAPITIPVLVALLALGALR